RRGAIEEAVATEQRAIDGFIAAGDMRAAGLARYYLARIHQLGGDHTRALRAADDAVQSGLVVGSRAVALAIRALSRVALGDVPRALADAREAVAIYDQLGGLGEGEAVILLAHAETLIAAGDPGSHAAVARAATRIETRANNLGDAALREGFLRVPE